jgi:thioredoxin-like negative regulator of GroEL
MYTSKYIPMNPISSSLLLCAIYSSKAFVSTITCPREIASDVVKQPKAVVFFGSRACRACNYMRPKVVEFANEQQLNDTAFYLMDIGGDMHALNFAQSCKIKTIPSVALFSMQSNVAKIHSCTPSQFNNTKQVINDM